MTLPYEEDAPTPQKKYVNYQERQEAMQKGVWFDAYGKRYELRKMVTPHIVNVLERLWDKANSDAERQNNTEAFGLDYYYDVPNEAPPRPRDDISIYFDPDVNIIYAKDLWDANPFVALALQELEKRGHDYIRPYDERRLPF